MARIFLNSIDLSGNQILNFRFQNLASDPSSPAEGRNYWNTSTKNLRVYDGTGWIDLGASGGGVTSVGGTAPIVSSGGASPTISIDAATTSTPGSMSAADKTKLDAATNSNTNSTLVMRDASGNFSAGTITATLSGSATTCTTVPALTGNVTTNGSTNATTIASGVITNSMINASAAIDLSKLATNPLARANHTGTQAASTISDFDTQVRTSRLDQMAAATSAVSLNSQRITNLAAPQNDNDAVNKAYADALKAGMDLKESVRVAMSTNVNLSSPGSTLDGITMVSGDRVLLYGQSTGSQNGLYTWNGAASAMTRTVDGSGSALTTGAIIPTEEGTHSAKLFILQTAMPITVGTTSLTFIRYNPGYGAGSGLSVNGTNLDVQVDGTTLEISSNQLRIKAPYGLRKYATTLGNGSSTTLTATHNFNTRDVTVELYENSGSYQKVDTDVLHNAVNSIDLVFLTAPTSNQYVVVVTG